MTIKKIIELLPEIDDILSIAKTNSKAKSIVKLELWSKTFRPQIDYILSKNPEGFTSYDIVLRAVAEALKL